MGACDVAFHTNSNWRGEIGRAIVLLGNCSKWSALYHLSEEQMTLPEQCILTPPTV